MSAVDDPATSLHLAHPFLCITIVVNINVRYLFWHKINQYVILKIYDNLWTPYIAITNVSYPTFWSVGYLHLRFFVTRMAMTMMVTAKIKNYHCGNHSTNNGCSIVCSVQQCCLSSGAVRCGHCGGCSRLGHFITTLGIFKRRNSHSTYVVQFLHALIILDIVDKKLPNSNANYENLFTHQFES